MTKDKDKVKMLDVQAGYETPVSTFDRNSIGYTDRPLNARTQTYNRYLDGCVASRINQSIPSGVETQITGFSYNTTGNYKFNATDNDSITIPIDGTYQIIVKFIAHGGTTGGSGYFLYVNGIPEESTVKGALATGENVDLIITNNYIKGQNLTITVTQPSGSNKDFIAYIYITKVS